jgi:hypothetical protein
MDFPQSILYVAVAWLFVFKVIFLNKICPDKIFFSQTNVIMFIILHFKYLSNNIFD